MTTKSKKTKTMPNDVCSKADQKVMEQIHSSLWENGWKLRTIGKRKHGWYFYIQERSSIGKEVKNDPKSS